MQPQTKTVYILHALLACALGASACFAYMQYQPQDAIPAVATNPQENVLRLTSPAHNTEQYALDDNRAYWITLKDTLASSFSFRLLKGSLEPSIYSSSDHQYIQYSYATDGKQAYYEGNPLPDETDIPSLVPIENGRYVHYYAKDRARVYFKSSEIVGADPSTFQILWTVPPEGCMPPPYAKDSAHVFYEDKLVKGADMASFEPLADDYGRDKNHVYFKGVMQQGVSPANFQPPRTCEYGAVVSHQMLAAL